MTRRLVLVRHAKAEPDAPSDAERPLSSRGRRDAAAIGHWLTGHGIAPDHVVVSPARRTRETWDAIAAGLAGQPVASYDEAIYSNDAEELIRLVTAAPASASTVVLVGHNPSMHAAACAIDDHSGDADARRWLRAQFPTSALAVFEIEAEWATAGSGAGRLIAATAPRG